MALEAAQAWARFSEARRGSEEIWYVKALAVGRLVCVTRLVWSGYRAEDGQVYQSFHYLRVAQCPSELY